MAASARAPEIVNVNLSRIEPLLDFINVMTYDYHGAPGKANFNSPLYSSSDDPTPGWNVDASMSSFIRGGVPAGEVVVGVSFYWKPYGQGPNVNGGLVQPRIQNPAGWEKGDGDWEGPAQNGPQGPADGRHWGPT